MTQEVDPQLPIQQHLQDLRTCIMRSLGALLVGFLACYSYA